MAARACASVSVCAEAAAGIVSIAAVTTSSTSLFIASSNESTAASQHRPPRSGLSAESVTQLRLSPNGFEIRLHDSTPRQKYQAKDRVRGSGHRNLALSQPACCVRLRRDTELVSTRGRLCPCFRALK